MVLIAHRREIQDNPNAYTTGLESEKLVERFKFAIKNDYRDVKFDSEKKQILRQIIYLIFQTQDNRPFFHVEGTQLPLCWNRRRDWNLNYIKYEWGHLMSRNQQPDIEKTIENLGLYSGRCNNQIQTSMNIQELMVYGGLIAQRISNVLTKRRILFQSKEWKELIIKLEQPQLKPKKNILVGKPGNRVRTKPISS